MYELEIQAPNTTPLNLHLKEVVVSKGVQTTTSESPAIPSKKLLLLSASNNLVMFNRKGKKGSSPGIFSTIRQFKFMRCLRWLFEHSPFKN